MIDRPCPVWLVFSSLSSRVSKDKPALLFFLHRCHPRLSRLRRLTVAKQAVLREARRRQKQWVHT
eukprot:EC794482.1.p3 GENE.EC794482.1~~EC794482.1.p3  ORF type:complete len:65 (+),score=10.35 EC794482.1:65-259(+)